MATQNLSQIVRFADVVWFKDRNLARLSSQGYGKLDDLVNSFTEKGWQHSGDGTVDVEPATADDKATAVKSRIELWESLKGLAKIDKTKQTDLDVFERLFVVKNKVVEPKYTGVSGNRRSEAFFKAMCERQKAGESVDGDIPVIVKTYKNSADRLSDQIAENEQKSVGFLPMSAVDQLIAADRYFSLGASQADLRRVFKAGQGQKLHGILVLDRKFPELGLVRRMTLANPEDPQFLRVQSVPQNISDVVKRTDEAELTKHNEKVKKEENKLEPLTQEGIIGALYPTKDGGNQPKVMKGDKIRQWSEGSKNQIIKLVLKCVAQDKSELIGKHLNADVGYNIVYSMVEDDTYPVVELLLARLATMSSSEREAAVQAFVTGLDKPVNRKPTPSAK